MKINIPRKPAEAVPPTLPERLAVNVKEAAHMLSVSERTVWTLAKIDRIKSKKIGGRIVFPVDSLRSFLDAPDDGPEPLNPINANREETP